MIPADPDTTALATYYDRPILKQPVWIWSVPAYFYVGGLAGAALVLGAVAQLTGDPELRPLVRTCRSIGAAGHVIGSALLIHDLGRPSRFFHMLRVFNLKSPLSIGSWILAAGGIASGLAATAPERKRIGRMIGNIGGLAAGTLGIPLAGYTGVLLSTTAVPVWYKSQRYLPVLFVSSAVASCASLFEMLELSPRETRIAHRFGAIGKAAELVFMTAVESDLSGDSVTAQPLRSGISGALWTASKVLTVASLAVSLMPGQSRRTRVAGVLGTMAGIGLRFAVFYAGFSSARDPRAASGGIGNENT